MHCFKDNAGRTWTIQIHVTAVKRTRAMAGVDLYSLIDEKFAGLAKLMGDPCSLVDVIYCLCKEEADRLGVSDEDFGRGMGGDSLEHAADAFLAELTDFFPDPRVRTGLTRVIEAGKRVRDRMIEHAEARLDQIDPDVEAMKLIASSGNSPELSVSPPVR